METQDICRLDKNAKVWRRSLACLVLLSLNMQSAPLQADTLSARPINCVQLQKNSLCEKNITISWQADVIGDYCLFADAVAAPVKCWQEKKSGNVRYLFKSDSSLLFSLLAITAEQGASEAMVEDSVATATTLFKVVEVYTYKRWSFLSFLFR